MDIMDYKSKMGSAILIAAASALVGACIGFLINRRGKKRKISEIQNDVQDTLRGDLDECRRLLDELRTRLEHETQRCNESEAWNRKLEQDLIDLAGARRACEERCVGLCADVERLTGELEEARLDNRNLNLLLKELRSEHGFVEMPSPMQRVAHSGEYNEKPKIPVKNSHRSFENDIRTKAEAILPENVGLSGNPQVIFGPSETSCVNTPPASNGVADHQIDLTITHRSPPTEHTQCYDDDYGDEEDFGDDEEDYSDEDESESGIIILQRNISQVSDDNFELGKDVMGALIANAFKDGVIASRDGDDISLSEDSPRDQIQTAASQANGHASAEHGEVSQESIGDTKTTRRFWEQMIAADKYDDDDVIDDDISDEDGNVTDEYDDITDEEKEQEHRKEAESLPGSEALAEEAELCEVEEVGQKCVRTDEKLVRSGDSHYQNMDVITNGSGVPISKEEHYESES